MLPPQIKWDLDGWWLALNVLLLYPCDWDSVGTSFEDRALNMGASHKESVVAPFPGSMKWRDTRHLVGPHAVVVAPSLYRQIDGLAAWTVLGTGDRRAPVPVGQRLDSLGSLFRLSSSRHASYWHLVDKWLAYGGQLPASSDTTAENTPDVSFCYSRRQRLIRLLMAFPSVNMSTPWLLDPHSLGV